MKLPKKIYVTKKNDLSGVDWLHVSEDKTELVDEIGETYIVGEYELQEVSEVVAEIKTL